MHLALVDQMVAWEVERFRANEYRGREGASAFTFMEGRIPALVSAPHAVTHMRDGRIKPSEDFTGAIALAVAQASGCHALVATRTEEADPNWDPFEKSDYKQALCNYVAERGIRFVLDVHGMIAASEALAAVGSADGATVIQGSAIVRSHGGLGDSSAADSEEGAVSLDERAAEILRLGLAPWCERFGKPVLLNGRYGARGDNTIARTVARESNVSALQIEVATQLRVPANLGGHVPKGEKTPFKRAQVPIELAARRAADPEAVLALVEALCSIVELGASSAR